MAADAVTPAEVCGLFRNVMRNAALFSTMSTKRKSRPKAAPVSGTALMKRTPAVGAMGFAFVASGLHALAAPATKHSAESWRILRMKCPLKVVSPCARSGVVAYVPYHRETARDGLDHRARSIPAKSEFLR